MGAIVFNIAKSLTVHHQNPQRPRCSQPLVLSGETMKYVDDYKYLGCWINEFGLNEKTVKALTTAASSYGRIVNIFKKSQTWGAIHIAHCKNHMWFP